MIRKPILLVAAISIIASTAFAQDMPKRKSGQWVSSSSNQSRPHRFTECVDHAADDILNAFYNVRRGKCSKLEFKARPGGYAIDLECVIDGATVRRSGIVTGSFDSEFTTEIETLYDPPWMARSPRKVVMISKWVGPCEPGLKPGVMKQASSGL